MANKSDVPALDRALDILEFVASENRVGYSRIVEKLDLPPASVARILKTLCNRDYLIKDDQTGAYQIGNGLGKLMVGENKSLRLARAGEPVLKQLRDLTSQTAILFYWNGIAWDCVAKETHENSITMQHVGETRVDVFDYPWGVFAYEQLKREGRKIVLKVNSTKLEKAWNVFERQGYVCSDGSIFKRLAAPILDNNGDLLGVLAMGVAKAPAENGSEHDYGELIKTGRKQIESEIQRSA